MKARDKVFYVYIWHDEEWTPYYVGKASLGSRYWNPRDIPRPPSKEHVVIFQFDKEIEVLDTEEQLIAHYGRLHEGGTLLNKLAGGLGSKDPCPDTLQKMKKTKRESAVVQENIRKLSLKNSKNYLVLTPDKQVIAVRGLSRFAEKRGLTSRCLSYTAYGTFNHHKGYVAFFMPDSILVDIDMDKLSNDGEYTLNYMPDFIRTHTPKPRKRNSNAMEYLLEAEVINEIKKLVSQGTTKAAVARLFDVTVSAVSRICSRANVGEIITATM